MINRERKLAGDFVQRPKLRLLCASVRPRCLCGEKILGKFTTEAQRIHRDTEK